MVLYFTSICRISVEHLKVENGLFWRQLFHKLIAHELLYCETGLSVTKIGASQDLCQILSSVSCLSQLGTFCIDVEAGDTKVDRLFDT